MLCFVSLWFGTIDSRYISQSSIMWLYTQNNSDDVTTSARLCIHKRHPISRPHGWAMVCLSWYLQRNMTAIYRERTVPVICIPISMNYFTNTGENIWLPQFQWSMLQCMKWPVAHSPNSNWFWLELVGNCCERLKTIMKCTNIQFCEQLGHGWQFHPLMLKNMNEFWESIKDILMG